MTRRSAGFTVSGALSALALVFASTAAAEPVGYLAGVLGSVEIRSSGSGSWSAGATDAAIELGDSVRTGPASAAKVVLNDDTILSIGEDTEVTVDSLVGGTVAAGGQPSVLRLIGGAVRTRVGEAFGGPTRLELHTPTAVVGVKGTDFETHLLAQLRPDLITQVCTWEGRVWTRNVNPAVRGEEEVGPGVCRDVAADKKPGAEYPIPADYKSVGPGPSSGAGASAGLVREAGGDTLLTDLLLETPPVGAGPGGDETAPEGIDQAFDPAQAAGLDGDDFGGAFDPPSDPDPIDDDSSGPGFIDPTLPPDDFVDPTLPPQD